MRLTTSSLRLSKTGETLIRVLLIEDNPGDADLIQALLAEARGTQFTVECIDRLSTGLKRLALGGIDIVLLDLSLPDSQGLKSLNTIQNQAANVPVVVLTGMDDEALALEAVQQGAQDYLVKGQGDGNVLSRSLRYAIERARSEQTVRESYRLIQQIVDILYFYDAQEQRIIYGSQRFTDLLGLQPEDLQRKRPSLPEELLHADDRPLLSEQLRRLSAAKEGEVVETEYRIRIATGEWRWLRAREAVFTRGPEGVPLLILSTAHDITELKQVRDQLQRLDEALRQKDAVQSKT